MCFLSAIRNTEPHGEQLKLFEYRYISRKRGTVLLTMSKLWINELAN